MAPTKLLEPGTGGEPVRGREGPRERKSGREGETQEVEVVFDKRALQREILG